MRYSLMKAFNRLLSGATPSGRPALNLTAVKAFSRSLYGVDGQIAFDRAVLYSSIIASLNDTQKAYIAGMKGKGFYSWPKKTEADVADKMRSLPPGSATGVMTYAGDIYSWYISLEALNLLVH